MPGADGCAEVRLEVLVSGTVYATKTERLLLSANVADAPAELPRAAMTIYFADMGESVWDIARRYGTTVSAVQEENGLADETVPEKRMLVIPTV
jgi:LysM repeat protein